jgi:pyrrolysine biosynthesis protein PylD
VTRLSSESVIKIGEQLPAYDAELVAKTGCTLLEIACQSAGVEKHHVLSDLYSLRVAVVPVTSGKGIIPGFVEAVKAITEYLGARAHVTENHDVAGLAEALEKEARVVFLADDNRFVALDLRRSRVIDNTYATGCAYAAALRCMVKDLSGRTVLLLGAGRVGCSAIQALQKMGAKLTVFEPDVTRRIAVCTKYGVTPVNDLEVALGQHRLIYDASPAAGIIKPFHIKEDTVIAAPGIPLGLTAEAYKLARDRIVHDPLQLGVATMLVLSAV